MTRLLDDQPVDGKHQPDKLAFHTYVEALERQVLCRDSVAPFVVGIYGPWGTGKTSLLNMLARCLHEQPEKWAVVEFSPWQYRQEKSLLLPLLATLAKKQTAFDKLVRGLIEKGPKIIETLAKMGPKLAQISLPMSTLLAYFNEPHIQTTIWGLGWLSKWRKQKAEEAAARDLSEKISEAVKETTKNGKRLAFLIDDLDRCHVPAQIVGLLEQIKLFLHLPHCVFFIAADRAQIVAAIDKLFQGEGERYLDKFVQLPFHLPSQSGTAMLDIFPEMDANDRACLKRIAETLGGNPRQLKLLWNRAHMTLELLRAEQNRTPQTRFHEPSLHLMLTWLLLSELPVFSENPYAWLELESQREKLKPNEWLKRLLKWVAKSPGIETNPNAPKLAEQTKASANRLAIYLWRAAERHPFGHPAVLSLYVRASGHTLRLDRQRIEESLFVGKAEFRMQDFSTRDFSEGYFHSGQFFDCDFTQTDLRNTDLKAAYFERCEFQGACFNGAQLRDTVWIQCTGLDDLATEPETYENLADHFAALWRNRTSPDTSPALSGQEEQLYKIYKSVLLAYQPSQPAGDIEKRLVEKGRTLREEILSAL